MSSKGSTKVDIPTTEDEPAELARFRNEWKAEVQQRKVAQAAATAKATPGPSTTTSDGPSTIPTSPPRPPPKSGPSTSRRKSSSTHEPPPGAPRPRSPSEATGDVTPVVNRPPTALSQYQSSALEVYRRAIQHEQGGKLDEALGLYRQAFRLDPNVDRLYHREEMLVTIIQAQQHPVGGSSSTSTTAHRRFTSGTSNHQLSTSHGHIEPHPAYHITGILSQLIASFPPSLKFEPEDETQPVHIGMLPDEILTMIMTMLDATSVERFGCVNRKTRVLSLDPVIWMNFVRRTYKPPQIPDIEDLAPIIEQYNLDHRRMYIEHPRVRLDGVYIAVCHYIRPGLSENNWVNINHLITYHRYLRFFPNGQVISLLANEEQSPQQVISLLKLGARRKGLFSGTWELTGKTVQLTNLIETKGKLASLSSDASSAPNSHSHNHSSHHHHADEDDALIRYAFSMELSLKSKPLGRWNRLDIEVYDSIKLDTGDIIPVTLKNERPFWFSKVRSYV